MAKRIRQISDSARAIAIIMAFFTFGWMGALIAKRKEWVWLLVLWIVGIVTAFLIVGFFILFAAWIWGLVVCITKRTRKNSM